MSGSSLINPPKRYLVESYDDGEVWYRRYSDGWLEQGGYVAYPDGYPVGYVPSVITFPKQFSQVDDVHITPHRKLYGTGVDFLSAYTNTNLSFISNSWSGNYHLGGLGMFWSACGKGK